MFATDPTLYGATLPRRELPFMNPLFAQQRQMLPWAMYGNPWSVYGQQQVPWSIYGQFPYSLPQTGFVPFEYTPIQHSYGMFGGPLPYQYQQYQPFQGFQSFYNVPQHKLQTPWMY